MTQIIGLLDKDFKITMIKMLKNLFEHVDSMHKDVGNFS